MRKLCHLLFLCAVSASFVYPVAALSALTTLMQQDRTSPGILNADVADATAFHPSDYRTFAGWKAACDRLPSNRSLKQARALTETLALK